MAIREGKWRCPYCAVVNRGGEMACSGCGATREKDVRFFLEDDAPEVDDADLLQKAEAGADWICQFCQTSSRPTETHCVNCGAGRGTSPSRPVQDLPSSPPPPVRAPAGRAWLATLLIALTLLLGFCAAALWWTHRAGEETVEVSGFEWQRVVEVEAYRPVRESAWESEVPTAARVLSRSREVHHREQDRVGTRRVKVGTRDKGNGFFEDVYREEPTYRERPVYAAKVVYEVDRWVPERKVRAAGLDQHPVWPDPLLHRLEREGSRKERYLVVLSGGKAYELELPQERWAALRARERRHLLLKGGQPADLR